MRVGISTASLFGDANLEDIIKTLADLDVEVCEVFLNTFREYRPEFASNVVGRLGKMSVHSVHTLNNFEGQLFNSYPRSYEDALEIFGGALRSGQILGAKYYTMHGTYKKLHDDNKVNYEKKGARYHELCRFASQFNMKITQENVSWACYEKPPYFSEIKKYAPELMACLDIKQAMRAEVPIEEYISDMSGSIGTVHLSDYDINKRLCAPGKGIVDYYALFNRLREVGFDGTMLIELYREDYSDYDELLWSRDYINEIIAKVK